MRLIRWILAVAACAAILTSPLPGKEEKTTAIAVRKIIPEDSEILEEWERVTNEPDVNGVSATKLKGTRWNWRIFVNAAEFVRKEPLESRLEQGITAALKKTKGVSAVVRDDREVWVVQAEASGADLVRSCAVALDQLAPEIRRHLAKLAGQDRAPGP